MPDIQDCNKCNQKTLMDILFKKIKIIDKNRTLLGFNKIYRCKNCGNEQLPKRYLKE